MHENEGAARPSESVYLRDVIREKGNAMATFRPDQENSVYIGQGVELTGEIRARDVIVVDGAYDGEIVCNHLIVGPTGSVKGKITATSAEISGHVSAEIATKQLMAVRSTGRVEGSWDCGAIEVARGAVLNGSANVAESTPAQRAECEAASAGNRLFASRGRRGRDRRGRPGAQRPSSAHTSGFAVAAPFGGLRPVPAHRHTSTRQISSAYSRIVRSEENHATRAVLRMAARRPGFLVAPARVDVALRGAIAVEILRHQKVIVIGQRIDELRVAMPVVRREHAARDRVERRREARARRRWSRARRCRARGLPPPPAAVRPKMKIFSSPTRSRISTLAPSSVPMVSAPFSANFILPVPDASMPAVEICSERSAAGMIFSARLTL